jgi:hypothetical protein
LELARPVTAVKFFQGESQETPAAVVQEEKR